MRSWETRVESGAEGARVFKEWPEYRPFMAAAVAGLMVAGLFCLWLAGTAAGGFLD
jgi:hypothetical protein